MEIDYLPILVSALVVMVLGALWYSPALCGGIWMKAMGYTKKDMEKAQKDGMAKEYLANFLSLVLMAFVLEYFISFIGAVDFKEGMLIGLLAWLGFTATVQLWPVLWAKMPFNVYLVNAGYTLVGMGLMGGLLVVVG
jgi:hypothetical protein